MAVKILLSPLMTLNGGWMMFDGFHVLRTGSYFGPDEPGSWAAVVRRVGLDPFSLGVPFVVLAVAWLGSLVGLLIGDEWAWYLTIMTAVATLWYIPVGTVISVIVLILVLLFRTRLGAG